MKTILKGFLLLLFFSFTAFKQNSNIYTIKIIKCDNISIPAKIFYKSKDVGSVYRILKIVDKSSYIGKIKLNRDFLLKNNMSVHLKRVLVGLISIEIKDDSTFKNHVRFWNVKDTIIVN